MLSRAVAFATNGPPSKVIRVISFPRLPPPSPKTVNLRYVLAPVNPSDINVIEGVYPAKPEQRTNLAEQGFGSPSSPAFVIGNEGLAEVTSVGEGVTHIRPGDRVINIKPQAGTWSTGTNVKESNILKIPDGEKLTEAQGATLVINPPTALNMLTSFVDLKPGDWVIQNGANSGVGQAVIQIAAARGLKSMNFIRNRPDAPALVEELSKMGATKVFFLEDLQDKERVKAIKAVAGGGPMRLALNCVSGRSVAAFASLLSHDAHLVTYGAMSREPLTLPSSAFIFKGLTAHGFMQGRWYKENSVEKREELMRQLTSLMVQGKLKEPMHEIVTIPKSMSDDDATEMLRASIERATAKTGMFGKKLMLKFEST